jgi:hypothetical protein
MMVTRESPVSSSTEATMSCSVQPRARWLKWHKWQQICQFKLIQDIPITTNSLKLGEACTNSEKKQWKKFWEFPFSGKILFQSSAAKTMAKTSKTSLKSTILVFVNRAAAELAGIWP